MAKAKPIKFQHTDRILNSQPAMHKAVYPGMIVRFRYVGDNVWDKSPLVLVIWNDYQGYKIHGINLNYLKEYKIKKLFEAIMEGASKNSKDDIKLTITNITDVRESICMDQLT